MKCNIKINNIGQKQIYVTCFYFLMFFIFNYYRISNQIVSPCKLGIHKAPGSVPLFDHFPGFPHKRFFWNMVVRITGKYFLHIFIIIILNYIDKILS